LGKSSTYTLVPYFSTPNLFPNLENIFLGEQIPKKLLSLCTWNPSAYRWGERQKKRIKREVQNNAIKL
jgi:hypothetical protein